MKKILIFTSLLGCMYVADAQQTNKSKTEGNRKSTENKNKSGTGTGTTGTGTMGSGTGTTGTTGTRTGTMGSGTGTGTGTMGNGTGPTGTTGTTTEIEPQNGTTQNGDISGTMGPTGRYAAMGVTTGSLHRKDAKFLVMAASSNTLELRLSELALQRATSQAVKDFAAMMVKHHTMAAQEMKSLLSSKGAMIPDTTLLPMHRTQMDMVMAAQGASFDKAYMRIMVDAHEEDVDEYEDEVTDARDVDIRAFAARMMPTLQTHYQQSKEIRKQVR